MTGLVARPYEQITMYTPDWMSDDAWQRVKLGWNPLWKKVVIRGWNPQFGIDGPAVQKSAWQ